MSFINKMIKIAHIVADAAPAVLEVERERAAVATALFALTGEKMSWRNANIQWGYSLLKAAEAARDAHQAGGDQVAVNSAAQAAYCGGRAPGLELPAIREEEVEEVEEISLLEPEESEEATSSPDSMSTFANVEIFLKTGDVYINHRAWWLMLDQFLSTASPQWLARQEHPFYKLRRCAQGHSEKRVTVEEWQAYFSEVGYIKGIHYTTNDVPMSEVREALQ